MSGTRKEGRLSALRHLPQHHFDISVTPYCYCQCCAYTFTSALSAVSTHTRLFYVPLSEFPALYLFCTSIHHPSISHSSCLSPSIPPISLSLLAVFPHNLPFPSRTLSLYPSLSLSLSRWLPMLFGGGQEGGLRAGKHSSSLQYN
jgi:hypothetical protein